MSDLKTQQQDHKFLLDKLQTIVGTSNCLIDPHMTKRYRTGFFFGLGDAIAVVKPANLVEYYQVVKACVESDIILINQAANTGVTGGSTPWGNDYDRPIVIINTLRIDGIQLINTDSDEPQAICHAGSTLYKLEEKLATIGREPHSVIGSSCIGASVVGGVCNNSGGTLVQRGPSYTELACYAHLNQDGQLEFVNNLGINLGSGTPEEQLARLEKGEYSQEDIYTPEGKLASSQEYKYKVVQVDADTPSRYNADPTHLKETSGSAGKLAVFAVRVDTFAKAKKQQMFYIGTNDINVLTDIRRAVLTKFDGLPVLGEYLSADSYRDAVKYAKDMFFVLDRFGTKHLPKMYNLKDFYDRNFGRLAFLPSSDDIMQFAADCLPDLLPDRLNDFRDKYQHHLLLVTADDLIQPTQEYLQDYFADNNPVDSTSLLGAKVKGDFFVCTPEEHKKAFLLRFSIGGSLARSKYIHRHETAGMIALDVALRRNDTEWYQLVPPGMEHMFYKVTACAHFLCHVFHVDYLVNKGYDLEEVKAKLLDFYAKRGAQYPAEHNVGHLYEANEDLVNHYKNLDPTNSFNPGIGKQTKAKYWQATSCCSHH